MDLGCWVTSPSHWIKELPLQLQIMYFLPGNKVPFCNLSNNFWFTFCLPIVTSILKNSILYTRGQSLTCKILKSIRTFMVVRLSQTFKIQIYLKKNGEKSSRDSKRLLILNLDWWVCFRRNSPTLFFEPQFLEVLPLACEFYNLVTFLFFWSFFFSRQGHV